MSRIVVYLSESEFEALRVEAERNLRGVREQARLYIRRGLLPTDPAQPTPAEAQPSEVKHDPA